MSSILHPNHHKGKHSVDLHHHTERSGMKPAGLALVLVLVCFCTEVIYAQNWVEQAILTASNKAANDRFGHSVSLTDNYALVGAYLADVGQYADAGAAYVFVRNGTRWTQQAILTARLKYTSYYFGISVSHTDDYGLVGSSNVLVGDYYYAGAAYVFTRSGATWTEQFVLTANNPSSSARFGTSVSLIDSYALTGAPGATVGTTRTGAAYIFSRSGSTWTQQAYLTANNNNNGDFFGEAVALTLDYALIGAFGADPGSVIDAGAAYIFSRSGTRWTQEAYLTASDKAARDYFGRSASLNNGFALVGAPAPYRTYKFQRSDTKWTEIEITDNCCLQGVTETENYKILGDPYAPTGGLTNAGQATIFINVGSDSESATMAVVIVGACAGFVGLAVILFCVHKRIVDKKERSSAAMIFDGHFKGRLRATEKDVMDYKALENDSPEDDLGSVFVSKPNANSASDSISLIETDRAKSSLASPQKHSWMTKDTITRNEVSEFGKYSDISKVKFSQINPIGSGAFGVVYRVQLSMGLVAVKVPKSNINKGSKEYQEMLAEAEFFSKLRHTNITLLLGYGYHPSGSIIFLMEYADCSLADVVKAAPLQFDTLTKYAHGIVRGLLYLHIHSPPISHRDLKPENVLIVGDSAKLADFGLATARDMVSKSTGFAGTPAWSPPESFEGKFAGPPGDIYSFGLLLWSMMTGNIPYEGRTFNEILLLKMKNQVPEIPSDNLPRLSKILEECWMTNPRQRPWANDLEKMFNEIRNI